MQRLHRPVSNAASRKGRATASFTRPARRRLRRAACVLLGLLAAALPATAAAEMVRGLYTARVAVPDQSQEARMDAIRLALEEVFVRVSGSSAASLVSAVENPGRFLLQYQYRTGDDGLILQAHLDPGAVERFLAKRDQVVWGRQRPDTLAWIAVQSPTYRTLLARDSKGGFAATVREAADKRGLPLRFPLMDTQDQSRVSFVDVWGGFEERVREASARYQADAVLIGRVERVSAQSWQARWTLLQGDSRREWESSVGRREAVLTSGIGSLAEHYLSSFASRPGGELTSRVAVRVGRVDDLGGYARLLSYLDSVSTVDSVQVTTVTPTSVDLEVALSGSVDRFAEIVRLGRVLDTAEAPPASAEEGTAERARGLHYVLARGR